MGDNVECSLLIELPYERVSLRRYANGPCASCKHGYHSAMTFVADVEADCGKPTPSVSPAYYRNDPRWPTACACGRPFEQDDNWQVFQERVYTRGGSGERMTLSDVRPGDMWNAWWYPWKGPDGLSLVVVLPNGHHWCIDSRAANCTLPDDDVHRCWVRTGSPPKVTVGKNAPGQPTCSAGAGSIGVPGWHGFLTDGRLHP